MKYSLIILFFLIVKTTIAQEDTLRIIDILDKMDSAITHHKTLEFKFYKEERCTDHNEYSISEVKVICDSTYCVYMKSNSPRDGMEILYREGKNDDKVLINPNSFPYFNMNIKPEGSLIRENQHHFIYNLGFQSVQEIVRNFRRMHADSLDEYIVRDNDYIWEKTPVYKIRIEYTPFGFYDYKVKEGQTVDSIANELFVNAYMIIEANEKVDDYDDIEAGQIIKVPNNYGKVCEMFIDKKNYLPIRQVIWDDKGLYEKYEYKEVKTSVNFEKGELESGYKDYGF